MYNWVINFLKRKLFYYHNKYDNSKKLNVVVYLKLSQVTGDYDHQSMRDLIREDKYYRWAYLLSDISERGIKEDIYIEDQQIHSGTYITQNGNHRLRILKHIYPENNIMRFKLKNNQ
tara:strand:- start:494 stop:844 length:351 start_codon:yes stop_codon:yes gene_type:complete